MSYTARNPLMRDDTQFTPPPQGGPPMVVNPLAPPGDWQDTLAPQPTQADAADATAKAFTDFQARDRAEQMRLGNIDADGNLTAQGWHQQAQNIIGGFGPADIGAAGGLLGSIKAYHGSPHSFDAFDMSKIGTGEGAQAFGHGLYFAGNEGVARSYRDALTPRATTVPPADNGRISRTRHSRRIPKMQGDMNLSVRNTEGSTSTYYDPKDLLKAMGKNFVGPDALPPSLKTAIEQHAPIGSMYEVNINADPEHFLHWDKPMSQQSEHVQDAIWGGGIEVTTPYWENGRSDALGSDYAPRTPEDAERLLRAGIPGIKYLDAGSRGAGEGTHNYVSFSDKNIDILRKYGIAGLIGGGAAATAAQGNQGQDQ